MGKLYSSKTFVKMAVEWMDPLHPPSGFVPGDTVSDLTGRGIELMAYRNDSDALNN